MCIKFFVTDVRLKKLHEAESLPFCPTVAFYNSALYAPWVKTLGDKKKFGTSAKMDFFMVILLQ
jgi:hypothetical protein